MKISERQRERAIKAKASANKRLAFEAHKKWMAKYYDETLEETQKPPPSIWKRLFGKISSSL